MATATVNQTKSAGNLFDQDITSVYTLELPPSRTDAYEIQGVDIVDEDEQYMLDALHQQYVAVEGRGAIAQLIDTRIGELATHSSQVMGMTMENIERIEAAAPLGRLAKRFHDFDNKLLDQTARHILETNAIAARTMLPSTRTRSFNGTSSTGRASG